MTKPVDMTNADWRQSTGDLPAAQRLGDGRWPALWPASSAAASTAVLDAGIYGERNEF